jgi:hypothetical protein
MSSAVARVLVMDYGTSRFIFVVVVIWIVALPFDPLEVLFQIIIERPHPTRGKFFLAEMLVPGQNEMSMRDCC